MDAGPSRSIPLSAECWEEGATAAANLAISVEPVEFRCEIEIDARQVHGPSPAQALYAADGTLLRPGGGLTYAYKSEVLNFDAPPQWVGLKSP
jgi:hypothetical protein